MAHHPRYQRRLDELFLHVYVYIDDWLKPYQTQLPKHSRQKASISELLTIAVMGELLAQPFESTWYRFESTWYRTDKARAVGPSSLDCAATLSGPFSELARVQPLPPGAQKCRAAASGAGALGYQQAVSAAPDRQQAFADSQGETGRVDQVA